LASIRILEAADENFAGFEVGLRDFGDSRLKMFGVAVIEFYRTSDSIRNARMGPGEQGNVRDYVCRSKLERLRAIGRRILLER
jgi:hypothetical protein